jgi:glycine cleavage system H protein
MSQGRVEEFQDGLAWSTELDGALVIGITESALEQSGALQGIELAEPGDEFSVGDWIGELRGKESVVEILAPCDLKILERNEDLMEQPAVLADDPTGDAWLLRVERLG